MPSLTDLFDDYSGYHKTAGNKMCHRLGIPMIMIGLFGILSYVLPLPEVSWIDGAVILIALAAIWYFVVDWRFGFLMILVSLGMWLLARQLPLVANIALFIGGWIVQFIGHGLYEHKSPAFMKNLTHLLVGPMWILNDLVPIHRSRRDVS